MTTSPQPSKLMALAERVLAGTGIDPADVITIAATPPSASADSAHVALHEGWTSPDRIGGRP